MRVLLAALVWGGFGLGLVGTFSGVLGGFRVLGRHNRGFWMAFVGVRASRLRTSGLEGAVWVTCAERVGRWVVAYGFWNVLG